MVKKKSGSPEEKYKEREKEIIKQNLGGFMSKLVKESFQVLKPILPEIAERCINQIAELSLSKPLADSNAIERAKKELIGLLVHIGNKPTEKILLKEYISDLTPSHFLKIIHPVQLSMTANSIIDSLKDASKNAWTEQTEREWRQLFHQLSDIISEEFLLENNSDYENDEHFSKSADKSQNKYYF